MSKKTTDTSFLSHIDWIEKSAEEQEARNIALSVEQQVHTTRHEQRTLLQEIDSGVFLLTIPEPKTEISLNIKKISDRVQYGMLPDKHNNESMIKLSYFQLRNLCYLEAECSWVQALSNDNAHQRRVHAIFFYHLLPLTRLWTNYLLGANLHIKEHLSNRLVIISNNTFTYPYNLAILPALCLWRMQPLDEVINEEMLLLKKKFSLFPQLQQAIVNKDSKITWQLHNGAMNYIAGDMAKSFDYATLVDDIIYTEEEQRLSSYINSFNLNDLDASTSFPTISIRSLVHLRARPDALSSLQKGYALCAAKECNGKQTPIETNNDGGFHTFNLWLKRASRHLNRHQYQARVVLVNDNEKQAFSLVGEQIASLATFPKLIKGVIEQLNFDIQGTVRLIAHNEDVLTIASEQASWNDINEVNAKASTLFKMVCSDGCDPLSYFEQIALPAHGVGSFQLSLVPEEYFELINTALTLKYSLPPGHDHYLLGLSYECLHEWKMAVLEFQRALRLDSQDSSILTALGSSLMELGEYEQALPFLKRAYDELPDDADLANTLGRLHLNFGNLSEAISAFERAVRLSPGSADFLANLGNGYLLAARPSDALDILTKAIRCNPSYAAAHECLAQLHLQGGDEDLAKKHALIAYRENPVDTNIANLLWRLTVGKKNEDNS